MPWPGGSRGEHNCPLPTGGERDAPRTSEPTGQHLYLIFDDWAWGYSIRKLKLPRRSPHRPSLRRLDQRRLPPPLIRLEVTRLQPFLFAAVGTNIIAAHRRYDYGDALVPEYILPIVDVSSRGVRFGPGLLHPGMPIFITVGDEVFALDMGSFRMLSMKPHCPRQEWSWCDLPRSPLKSLDVTAFAVGSDGRTIFASTDCATFAFDIVNSEWKQSSNCSLPFAGPANYVHALDIFVGLSKAPDTYGHLCFCRKLVGDYENVRPCKENLLSKDPAESHIGATLVYLGGGSEPGFCLVECVKITKGKSVNMRLEECDQLVKCVDEGSGNCDQLKKNVDDGDGASGSMQECGDLDELKMRVDEGDGTSGSMQECGELDELKMRVDEGDGTSGSMQECGELDELKMRVDEGDGMDEGDGTSGSMQECGELDELKMRVDEGDGASGSMQECGELDELKMRVDEGDGVPGSMHDRYLYRLTTFSLSFDNNGDLTTGETCVVQCYKVPEKVSQMNIGCPVAFWL